MKLVILILLSAAIGSGTLLWIRRAANCPSCRVSGKSKDMGVANASDPLPQIPGNPLEAVTDFKRLYQAIDGFRRHYRRFPTGKEFHDYSHPLFARMKLSDQDFECSDAKRPEYLASNPHVTTPLYSITFREPRYDGRMKPVFPPPGERDLWAVSWHYRRSRQVKTERGANIEYFGSLVGLFSDGQVIVLPMAKALRVRRSERSYWTAFPQESGVPRSARPINENVTDDPPMP